MNDLVTVNGTPAGFVRLAIEKNLDTDKLRELMNLEKEWRAEQAKAAYAQALSKFEGIKKTITYNRQGTTAGNARFGYADFPEMVTSVSPWLSECGLSFSHRQDAPVMNEAGIFYITVYCRVCHVAGHCEEVYFPAMPDERLKGKVSPSQLIQMAITYAKRQTLAMVLGLATAEDKQDDDSAKQEPLITEKQAADLTALVDEVVKNKSAFMKWLGVEKISDLKADKYKKAINQCEKLRKQA